MIPSNPNAHDATGRPGMSSAEREALRVAQTPAGQQEGRLGAVEAISAQIRARVAKVEKWQEGFNIDNGATGAGNKWHLIQNQKGGGNTNAIEVIVTGSLNGQPAAGVALYSTIPRVQ